MLPYYARISQSAALIRAPEPEEAEKRRVARCRPHEPATLDRVRQLYETTLMPLRAIGAATGASAATVSRHARRGGWLRPGTGLPVEHYSPEGRRKLRRGALAESLLRQAEHLLFQQEMDPTARRAGLDRALRLVRLSRTLDEEERPQRQARKRSPLRPQRAAT